MKPVVLVCRPAAGGMRAHILSLLRLLDRSKWQLYLIAPEELLQSLPQGLPFYHPLPLNIPPFTTVSDLFLARQLAGTIREIRAEAGEQPIVHAHGLRAAWIGAWANTRLPFPLIVTLHNIPGKGPLARSALGFVVGRSTQIVCVSQAVAGCVASGEKRVIPNGIDLARFTASDRAKARQELQIASEVFVVATVARLSHEKGIDILLKVAARAPDMAFLIAGSGPDERQLAAVAPKNARFLGRIENVETLFAACDVTVIPSQSEGQGIVALEAMASAAPVVATRVGGLGEMVRDEETGLVVPPEAPAAILQAITRLRDNPDLRARIAAAGKEYALRYGDVQDMIRALEEVYETAARRSS